MDIYQNLHLVYKISSTFSNDFYIGRKTLKNLNQFNNYWSSSKKFKKFVLNNGKNNFIKEILFQFDNEQDQVEKENYFNLNLYKNDPNCWSRGSFTGMVCKSSKKCALKMVEDGTNRFVGGEIQRKFSRKRVEDGTHNFLGGEIQRKRVEDVSHHLLSGEIQRKSSRKRVEDGTHNFLGKGRDDHPGKKNKGKIYVNNGNISKRVLPNQLQEFLNNGFVRGRLPKRLTI
jgi:hypothetical protein